MRQRTTLLALALVWFGRSPAGLAQKQKDPPKPPPEHLVLNQSCYWRHYYTMGLMRLSARELKKAPAKWFTPRFMDRLEKDTRKLLKDRAIDWDKTDWRDVAVTHIRHGMTVDQMSIAPTVHPPPDWMMPGFDDTGWVRQRIPAYPYHRDIQRMSHLYVRGACLRTTFLVPDPRKVKVLKCSLVYRGGVRVFLNGQEIARGHLPAGKLAPDAAGADYPEEAYRAFLDEVPEPNKGRRCVSDIRLSFEDSPKPRGGGARMAAFRNTFSCLLNRKGWERIPPLRDRTLPAVSIPPGLLRKGSNVLAVEIRGSPYHPIIVPGAGRGRFYSGNWGSNGNETWSHARLIELKLTDPAGVVPAAMARPEGVQVWVEDMHTRCYPEDYLQPGSPMGTVRMVGGLNGSYSGQVVVGTGGELTGLKASAGDLARAGGGKPIPASAVRVLYMVPEPVNELYKLGYGRGISCGPMNAMAKDTTLYVSANPLLRRGGGGELLKREMDKAFYFDHLSADAPARVPAGSCQPIFLSLKVPADAAAGSYRGQVRIEAAGMPPTAVPVELEVLNWRVPDPLDFQTDVLLEQSPYGLLKHFKPAGGAWSDEHFRLMETAFKLLGRIGNDIVYVPILHRMEFGNHEDSMVRWVRRKGSPRDASRSGTSTDESLSFDYRIMDRYLDLAVKHLGKPKVLSIAVMHNMRASAKPAVTVHGPAGGKSGKLDLSWESNPFDRIGMWKAFATGLVGHLRSRHLADSIFWGHAGDHENDPGLIYLLSELFPEIFWTASTHSYRGGAGGGGHDPALFKSVSEIYGRGYRLTSEKGWLIGQRRAPEKWHNTNAPRGEADGINLPFTFRSIPDRAIRIGYTGVGRMGFDYYDGSWLDGYIGCDWLPPGIPCFTLSYPGGDRVESCARFEAMLEGVQDSELRCFLEQAVHRGVLPADLAQEALGALFDRHRAALCNRFRDSELAVVAYGWQDHSRRVYDVAARVAQSIGLDVDHVELTGKVPALGRTQLELKIRNWSGKPRPWKAASSEKWLLPARTSGTAAAHEPLTVTLDGAALKTGQELAGTLTVTDVAAGTSWPVAVSAKVTRPMELLFDHPHFNVTVGESETREFRVVNHTVAEQPWRLTASAPWIRIEPASGSLGAGEFTFVRLTAAPPDRQTAIHENVLTFTGAGGAAEEAVKSKTFVIPIYRDPGILPFGRVVKIEKADRKLVKRHRVLAVGDQVICGRRQQSGESFPRFGHECRGVMPILGRKRFDRALWTRPSHETVYNLVGSGFTAFSAYVGIPVDVAKRMIRQHERRVNFEIWVDGNPVLQSGMMRSTDRGRLMVVEDLKGAKELKLVTRLDSCGDNSTFLSAWANAQFYREP